MDVEKVFSLSTIDDVPYRAVIGWSDTYQEYYACIETAQEPLNIFWKLPSELSVLSVPVIIAIAASVVEAFTESDNRWSPTAEDIVELEQAPRQRLVSPSEIEDLGMLDTDYAKAPIYGDSVTPSTDISQQLSYAQFLHIIDSGRDVGLLTNDARIEDLQQTVQDCLAELEVCASCLKTYIGAAQQSNATVNQETLDSQCNNAIVFTAGQLIQTNEALFRSLSLERIAVIASASEDSTATIDQIYTPEEIDRINAVTINLCGSKLTNFRQAIERGYEPTTGLPLGCPNPESFNWAETVEDADITVYLQYGLSTAEAEQMMAIERTDPRYRSEDDWDLRNAMALRMQRTLEQRREDRK